MAKQITKYTYERLKNRLLELENELPSRIEDFNAAYKEGDTSDNADFDAARDRLSATRLEISKIRELLQYEIIPYDTSPRISMGSMVTVRSPELYNGKPKTYILEEVGGTIIEGVLNTESPLGRVIKDNLSADYTVNGHTFSVVKEKEPDLNKFMEEFPGEDSVIARLFTSVEEESSNV